MMMLYICAKEIHLRRFQHPKVYVFRCFIGPANDTAVYKITIHTENIIIIALFGTVYQSK